MPEVEQVLENVVLERVRTVVVGARGSMFVIVSVVPSTSVVAEGPANADWPAPAPSAMTTRVTTELRAPMRKLTRLPFM